MPLLKLFTKIFKWDDSLVWGTWVYGGSTKKGSPLLVDKIVFEAER